MAVSIGAVLGLGKDYDAIGRRILVDPEVFGNDEGTLKANQSLRQASAELAERLSSTVSWGVSGAQIGLVTAKYGKPQQIEGNIYWYGKTGFKVTGGGFICEVVCRP